MSVVGCHILSDVFFRVRWSYPFFYEEDDYQAIFLPTLPTRIKPSHAQPVKCTKNAPINAIAAVPTLTQCQQRVTQNV